MTLSRLLKAKRKSITCEKDDEIDFFDLIVIECYVHRCLECNENEKIGVCVRS